MENSRFRNEFLRTFSILCYGKNRWDIWRDFVYMSSAAFSNRFDSDNYERREQRYLDIIKRYKPNKQIMFAKLLARTVMALEEDPNQDFLGSIFMELNLGNGHNGQFFTPYSVCQLMAEINLGDIVQEVKDQGYISISDCACGAGATLIAAINCAKTKLEKEKLNYQNHIFVVAQDIDEVVALMCYIQLSLLGVAGFVKVGDSLVDPVSESDTHENYWYMPMYYTKPWLWRKYLQAIKKLF